MSKKDKIIVIIIIVMLAIAGLSILLFNNEEKEPEVVNPSDNNNEEPTQDEEEPASDEKIYLEDINRFSTINGSLMIYYGFLSNELSQNIYTLLDAKYISENSITISNLLNKIDSYDYIFTYNTEEIYYKTNDNEHNVYYVKGTIKEDIFDLAYAGKEEEVYNIIYLDDENLTFSIYPITKSDYENSFSINEEDKYEKRNIPENTVNEYRTYNLTHKEIATMYFVNFKSMYIYELEEANELISSNSATEFILNELTQIETYSVGNNLIIITDNNGFEYKFEITHVLNYKVSISNE